MRRLARIRSLWSEGLHRVHHQLTLAPLTYLHRRTRQRRIFQHPCPSYQTIILPLLPKSDGHPIKARGRHQAHNIGFQYAT